MDAWLPEIRVKDQTGHSLIIVRNAEGQTLCDKAQKEITLTKINNSEVIRSQGWSRLTNRDLQANINLSKIWHSPCPEYSIRIPNSRAINHLRSLISNFNIWISSNQFLKILVDPLAYLEIRLFRRTKNRI